MSESLGVKIKGIATTGPSGNALQQQSLYDDYFADHFRDVPAAGDLYLATNVKERRLAWNPQRYREGFPGVRQRMEGWEQHATEMGRDLLTDLLRDVDRSQVGSFVMTSCTGYAAPSPDIRLAAEFGLRSDLRRTFIGHMGCSAAFNALKVGADAVTARPDELAVLTCVETSSLHLRDEPSKEQTVITSLFSDAGAGLLLGPDDGSPGPVLVATHTETFPDLMEAMTWRWADDALRMTLSPLLSVYLAEVLPQVLHDLLGPVGLTVDEVPFWGIHPGGPKIIDVVGACFRLSAEQLAPSRHILATRGNCSSPTVLLTLAEIMAPKDGTAAPQPGDHAVILAFGPGVVAECALLRF